MREVDIQKANSLKQELDNVRNKMENIENAGALIIGNNLDKKDIQLSDREDDDNMSQTLRGVRSLVLSYLDIRRKELEQEIEEL